MKSRRRHTKMAFAAAALIAATIGSPARAVEIAPGSLAAFRVVADGIPEPIGAALGDAERGRALVVERETANCVLCHALTDPRVRFAGNLGPSLDGVARRFTVPQLRLRVADSLRLDPATIMPSYYRIDGLDRVARVYRGKPILDAGQIEDIVAYLATLK